MTNIGINEVAKVAGVSTGTVSNVINNRSVTEKRRQIVLKAMRELGYEPKVSRRPRPGRRRAAELKSVSLLILNDSVKSVLRHPVYFNLIHGIERACDENGLPFRLRALPTAEDMQRLIVQKDEGLLLFRDGSDLLPEGFLNQVPAVKVLNSPIQGLDYVTYNDVSVGQIAAQWLVAQGVQNAGVISSAEANRTIEAIRILEASHCHFQLYEIHRTGPAASLRSVLDTEIDDKCLRADLAKMFRTDQPVDGLFLYSDELAAHVYPILYEMGIKPGRDVHVISCNNDQSYLTGLTPRPATIDIFAEVVGHTAVDFLLLRAKRPDDPAKSLKIEPSIIVPEY